MDVVTFGEPLIVLSPEEPGLLRDVSHFRSFVGGAELNFAIGASRLGITSGWFGRVGSDEFGAQVTQVLRATGVDTSRVISDPQAPTAVMFKEYRGFADPRVIYYRKGSAASRLSAADVDPAYLASAKYLHVTGITAALSDSCREAVHSSMRAARSAGVQISFDPNIRRKLMPAETLHDLLLPLVDAADLLLLGLDEGELLFGVQGPEAVVAAALARGGPRTVVVKMADQGCLGSNGRESIREPAFPVAHVVDTVGAGDGFDAGFIAGLVHGLDFRTSLRLGAIAGAAAVTVRGDYEGYPLWAEVQALLSLGPQSHSR